MNVNWRVPASEPEKQKVIGKEWGTKVDTYLWYELGIINQLTRDEVSTIITEFFVSGKASFGDVELHQSELIDWRPTILRLRGNLILRPSLMIRDRYCPLYQVGHFGSFVDRPSNDCINFYKLWLPDGSVAESLLDHLR